MDRAHRRTHHSAEDDHRDGPGEAPAETDGELAEEDVGCRGLHREPEGEVVPEGRDA